MAEVAGNDVVVLVNLGDDTTPSWQIVGSQRGATFNETVAPIDISSKDQREEKNSPRGRWSCVLSLDALYVPGAASYLALRNAQRDGNTIKIKRQELGQDVEEANAVVTGLSQSFPDADAATIAAEFRINGPWQSV